MNPGLAALIAAMAALGGRLAGWLTGGGALVATVTGGAVLTGAGPGGLVLLGTFFLSGSLLSARGGAGSRRRAGQVLANGWAAALGGLVILAAPQLGWAILAGALAAAQADTWATELGRRSRRAPRRITDWAPVAAGTSGAVSFMGTLGAGAGAILIAVLVQVIPAPVPASWVAAAGVTGMFADSVLGATVQARFVCASCGGIVEDPRHCDADAAHTRGVRWMTNDMVNVFGTGVGAAIAVLATVGWR